MEARSTTAAVCLGCLLLAAAGCPLQNGKPAARPEESDSPALEQRSEVVAAGTTQDVQSAADVDPGMDRVQRWIEQIQRRDDTHVRIAPQPWDESLTPVTTNTYQSDSQQSATPPQLSPTPDSAPAQPEQPSSPEAPVLGSVSVRAAAAPATTPPHSDAAIAVNAPSSATSQTLTLTEFAEQWLDRPVDPSFRNQLDQRLLQILAGKYDNARRPLELVSNEQQQMATEFIEMLIAVRQADGGEPSAEAARVLAQLKRLEDSLVPLSDLRIPTLALARAVRGFGRYEAFDPAEFFAGRENEFVVYCEVDSFASRLRDDGRYESQFSMRTSVLNRAGDVVLEISDDDIADECRTRRHDCFIPRLVRLPATLSPGQYVVKVTIIDKIAQKVAEKRTTFRLVARS